MKYKSYSDLFSSSFFVQVSSCAALLLICFSASIKIYQVPFTLHTFGIVLGSFVFSRKSVYSAISLNIFFKLVFFGLISIELIGYWIGFFIASAFICFLKNSRLNRYMIACTASLLILITGTSWIALIYGITHSISIGLLPFILKDTFLTCLAARVASYVNGRG